MAMKPLPLPLRLAAGLVATAVEQARDLPRLVAELPITAVSQTLQASMRVQQRVTELAIKGDRALAVLRPVEEKPSWATFDDDEDDLPFTNGVSTVTQLRPPPPVQKIDVERFDAVEDLDDVEDAEALGLIADVEEEPAPAPAAGPSAMPEYPTLTIPQLRGRLRHLSIAQLTELLTWETAHDDRAPFVTMLSNRITTVSE